MTQVFFDSVNEKFRGTAEQLHGLVLEMLAEDQLVSAGKSMISYGKGSDGHQLVGIAVRSQGAMLYAGAGVMDKHADLLGKKRTGKTCLRIRKIEDVPLDILKEIISSSLNADKMDYGC